MILSVIIVNYKNEDMTVSFVLDELSKIAVSHNVVIVNNAATCETDQVLSSKLKAEIVYEHREIKNRNSGVYVLHNDDNPGFAKANNDAVEFVRKNFNPNYLLFTNNDIKFIDTNVVEALINKISVLPTTGIIGPKVIGLDGKLQSPEPFETFYKRMIKPYLDPFFSWLPSCKSKSNYSDNAKEGVHYRVMGSFFLCNSSDYYDCGMMDPNTFLYFEECILSERRKKIGKNVYYYPCVQVLHAHNQTIGKFTSFKKQRDYMFESGAYYFKNYKNVSSFYIRLAWIAKEITKVLGSIRRSLC